MNDYLVQIGNKVSASCKPYNSTAYKNDICSVNHLKLGIHDLNIYKCAMFQPYPMHNFRHPKY